MSMLQGEQILPGTRAADRRLTLLEPPRGWASPHLGELWQHRELLVFLAWRDVKVRYTQTAVGVAWIVLQPLLTVLVFTVLFGHLGRLPSSGQPYALLVFSGILPWTLFANSLMQSSLSLVANQSLVTKVYVPRLLLPLAATLSLLVDFCIGFVVLLVLMAAYGFAPPLAILALPALVVLVLACALSIGVWLAAVNVRYRDVQYAIPFLVQIWLFVTPVAYSAQLIPERWRLVYGINPMAGVVESFRWALLGEAPSVGPLVALSVGLVVLLLLGGIAYFRQVEATFADVI
jgi:lipopolysaccharide transport system permease protein